MSIFITEEELKQRKCVGLIPQNHRWVYWESGVKECKKCGVKVLKFISDRTFKSNNKEFWAEKHSIWR